MTLAPRAHRDSVQFNSRELGVAVDEAGMLRHRMEAESVEKWRASLLELGECDPGDISVEECDGLVDGLVEIIRTRGFTKSELDKVGTSVVRLYTKFGESAEYSILLERMLDKVYMVPGGHVGLGALLGGIGIEDETDDRFAYFALDVIRVILRCLFLREDVLQESKSEILGVCYDGILRVALRNKLENLANIMKGSVARMEFCGSDSEICRMAMLRISVYDKRDVPSDDEILGVLSRYPALSAVLEPERVLESKRQLTRLIHYISLNHLVNQESHGWVYAAVAESNIRIRYWLDKIYRQHGISNNPEQDVLDEVAQKPSLVATNIMVSIRYLTLEIHDFWELYGANHELVKDLEINDPMGVYKIIQGHGKTKNGVQTMRKKFGAHPDWTFKEAASRIDAMGLDRLVLYAHLVLMFQDAVYRTIPSRHRRDHLRDERKTQILGEVEPVAKSEREEITRMYSSVSVVLKDKNRDKFCALQESLVCMMLLYTSFRESLDHRKMDTLAAHLRFSNEVYNVKYMILELVNFIQQYEEMVLGATREDKEFTPRFLRHKETYREFRNNYAAHTRMDGIRGIQQLTEKNPNLISDILRDIVEMNEFVMRISGEFQECKDSHVTLMTVTKAKIIEKKLDKIRRKSNGCYDNEFVDPDHGQNIQRMRDEVRDILGLE